MSKDCTNQLSVSKNWVDILNNTANKRLIVADYLSGRIDFSDLNKQGYSTKDQANAVDTVVIALLNTSIDEIKELLKSEKTLKEVTAANIPQFSNFATAAICVPEELLKTPLPITYTDLGYLILADCQNDGAACKYGENHGKLAALLDLAERVHEKNHPSAFKATLLTSYFCNLEQKQRMNLLARLCFRVPVIQHAIVSDNPTGTIDKCLSNVLSDSTCKRRRPNVFALLTFALGE